MAADSRPARAAAAPPVPGSFVHGLGRALGGAVIFTLPMLMTREMWVVGSTMPRHRLIFLLLAGVPLLVGLSRVSGFKPTTAWIEDVVDAFVAYAIGFLGAALVLLLFGEIGHGKSFDATVGTIALQAIPASMGALLAQSKLMAGGDGEEGERGEGSFWGELFLMAAGALVLAFNIAPTEEIIDLAYQIDEWAIVVLAVLSIAAMHGFVYALGFRGQELPTRGSSLLTEFFRLTTTGYAIALTMSAVALWAFGRLDQTALLPNVTAIVVVAFPAAIGAAAARLIL